MYSISLCLGNSLSSETNGAEPKALRGTGVRVSEGVPPVVAAVEGYLESGEPPSFGGPQF